MDHPNKQRPLLRKAHDAESVSRRSATLGVIAALCFFVINASTISIYYLVEKAVIEREFRNFMQSSARLASLLVDGDLHQTFTRKEQHVTQVYKDATEKLAKAVQIDPRIKYIYTYIEKDNTLYYILDPSEPEDFDHDGKADYETPLMLEENEGPGLMRQAIAAREPMVEREPAPSLWGMLITAYSPIYNSQGEFVAMLGMDVTANDYYAMVKHNQRMFVIVLGVQLLMSLFVGFLVVVFYRMSLASRRQAENARKAAEAANIAKSEFLANMSHEMLTPLHSMIGMTQMIAETQLSDTQKQLAQSILSSGHALEVLMQDLLDLSKMEMGKLPLHNATFNLPAMLSETMLVTRPKAEAKKLMMHLHYADDLPKMVYGDEGKLRQILMNFIGNAIKFTPHGHITINVKCTERSEEHVLLHIDVTDTGIGIEEDKLDYIFGHFNQVSGNNQQSQGGAGLGLAISKQLAELMRGKVGVRSRRDVGSIFWLEVPLSIPKV